MNVTPQPKLKSYGFLGHRLTPGNMLASSTFGGEYDLLPNTMGLLVMPVQLNATRANGGMYPLRDGARAYSWSINGEATSDRDYTLCLPTEGGQEQHCDNIMTFYSNIGRVPESLVIQQRYRRDPLDLGFYPLTTPLTKEHQKVAFELKAYDLDMNPLTMTAKPVLVFHFMKNAISL